MNFRRTSSFPLYPSPQPVPLRLPTLGLFSARVTFSFRLVFGAHFCGCVFIFGLDSLAATLAIGSVGCPVLCGDCDSNVASPLDSDSSSNSSAATASAWTCLDFVPTSTALLLPRLLVHFHFCIWLHLAQKHASTRGCTRHSRLKLP